MKILKKIIQFNIIIFLLIILVSCKSINNINQATYDQLNDYIKTIGDTCIIYVKNDDTLSTRQKNVFYTRQRLMKEALKEFKVKNK